MHVDCVHQVEQKCMIRHKQKRLKTLPWAPLNGICAQSAIKDMLFRPIAVLKYTRGLDQFRYKTSLFRRILEFQHNMSNETRGDE